MPSKILLIKYYDDLNIRPFPKKAERTLQIYPSLGLGYLAAFLRQNGFPVEILDLYALNLPLAEVPQKIAESKARIVGITATTVGWPGLLECAGMVRKALPQALIVAGGPQLYLYPQECLSFDRVDLGVVGDGEETFLEIAQKVDGGEKPSGIRGTVERVEGKPLVNPPRAFIEDLDSLPYPAVDLMPLERYNCLTIAKPFFTMISSRGCPYRCAFCTQVFCGEKTRLRSPENVVGEIELYVKRYHAKEIIMFDETFTLSKKRVLETCRLIKENKLAFRFNIRTRADLVDREILEALKEAGCYGLHIGVESGDEKILALMNKGITLEQVREVAELGHRLGFQMRGYFMLGYLGETRESLQKTIKTAQALPLDWASFSLTTPMPGTELYRQAREQGLIKTDFWREYTLGKVPPGKELFPHLGSENLSEAELKSWWLKAYTGFYLRPGFMWQKLMRVKNLQDLQDLFNGCRILLSLGS